MICFQDQAAQVLVEDIVLARDLALEDQPHPHGRPVTMHVVDMAVQKQLIDNSRYVPQINRRVGGRVIRQPDHYLKIRCLNE